MGMRLVPVTRGGMRLTAMTASLPYQQHSHSARRDLRDSPQHTRVRTLLASTALHTATKITSTRQWKG